jgi:hypothetical protein
MTLEEFGMLKMSFGDQIFFKSIFFKSMLVTFSLL